MTEEPSILLTNDDGIDAPGIQVLADALTDVGSVTVLAPVQDESGTGRTRTFEGIVIEEHDYGHAVHGTPVDCVIAGVVALERDFDVVVSGANAGPNVGAHILGRSGTVGAAVEAGFLGLPSMAVSMYDVDEMLPRAAATEQFELAARVTRSLLRRFFEVGGAAAGDGHGASVGAGDDAASGSAVATPPESVGAGWGEALGAPVAAADYVNVNVPSEATDPVLRLTQPSDTYDLRGTVTAGEVELEDVFWRDLRDGDVADPVGTDTRACADGEVSITPMSVHRVEVEPAGSVLDGVVVE